MLDLLPEICDHYPKQVQVLPPIFRRFGGKEIFWGSVVTVRCPMDNSLVRQLLAEPGHGRVLFIDGLGNSERALLGDQLAQSAYDNGWSGIVVHGCVRDVATLATIPVGIQAIAATPMKTDKRGEGEKQVTLSVLGRTITPGDYIYADDNGVVISEHELDLHWIKQMDCNCISE